MGYTLQCFQHYTTNNTTDSLIMMKKSVTDVQAQLDTHEAVCAERWKETILRIKRIEAIMIGTAGAVILLLITILVSG